MRRVIVAGGGTGGHLFPGLAVVEELRRRLDVDVLFLGTERGIESRVLPKRGERLECLEVTPLKGRSPKELVKSLGRLPKATMDARKLVQDFDAELVIGVGGYASGPAVLGAASLRVPCALLEQNAHVGLTNKGLSKVVGRAYLAFEGTKGQFGSAGRVVGNPIRRELARVARHASMDPEGFEARAKSVLIFGGSQGAKALNDNVPGAMAKLAEAGLLDGVKIVHQTGRAMFDEVRATYEQLGLDAEVTPFIEDMASAYTDAAVVIARAGATTLAELSAMGRPSILIPLPTAADDHQTKNARALEDENAAICLPQADLTPLTLRDHVGALLGDRNKRLEMSRAARNFGKPDAAAEIVDDLCAWLGWDEGKARVDSIPPAPPAVRNGSAEEGEGSMASVHGLRGEQPYVPRLGTHLYRAPSMVPPRPQRPLVFD